MEKKQTNWKRRLLQVLCVILGLILAAVIACAVLLETVLGQINRPDPSEPTLSDEQIQQILNEVDETDPLPTTAPALAPDDTVPPAAAGETLPEQTTAPTVEITLPPASDDWITKSEHVINILLIGQDRRPGEGRQRSDSMILVTVNKQKKTLVMTSFMRDLYVNLPEWNGKTFSPNRLNVNYALGGMGMLDKCLLDSFGVVVDHNIEVDFSGFKNIINALGGVDINLTEEEALHLHNSQGGLHRGINRLYGEAALAYARIRKLDGDYQRTARQRRVLTAVLEKCRSMDPVKLTKLVDTVLPMITTDMTNSDIAAYVVELLPLLPQLTLETQTIPTKGFYTHQRIRGMSVVVADMEQCRRILEETIGG